MAPAVGLAEFRRLTQAASVLSVAALAVAIYLVLPGHRNLWLAAGLAAFAVGTLFAASRLELRGQAGSERVLVLVTKRDCALCDEAAVRLPALAGPRNFDVRTVSIERNVRLRRRYRDWVPVVLWQHEELAKGLIDWDVLAARLDAIAISDKP